MPIQLSPAGRAKVSLRYSRRQTIWIIPKRSSPAERLPIWRQAPDHRNTGGKREGTFNLFPAQRCYGSFERFLKALINQETLDFDIENAMQFERLSIPKRLEQVENELKSNRIADPECPCTSAGEDRNGSADHELRSNAGRQDQKTNPDGEETVIRVWLAASIALIGSGTVPAQTEAPSSRLAGSSGIVEVQKGECLEPDWRR